LINRHKVYLLEEEAYRARLEKRPKGVYYFHMGLVRLALTQEFGVTFDSETINRIASDAPIK
jgi:hypothetical protein